MKKIYPILSLAVASLLPAALHADFSTSFTAAEGYSDGLLSNNANWNEGGQTDIYTVDSSGAGQVNLSTTSGTALAVVDAETYDFTQAGNTFSLSMDFQFTVDGTLPVANTDFISTTYTSGPISGGLNKTSFGLRYRTSGAYQLLLFGTNATAINEESMGINTGLSDFQSDVLRLDFTFTSGETSADWFVEYAFSNITNPATITSGSRTQDVTTAAAQTAAYAAISSGAGNHNGIEDINILSYSSSAVIVPEPSTYAFVFGGLMLVFAGYRRMRK